MIRKKALSERMIAKLMKWGKKNAVCRIPALICVTVILFVHDMIIYFSTNGKRFASIAVVGLFFMTGSSFSFPNLAAESVDTVMAVEAAAQEAESKEGQPQDTAQNTVEVLDDSDVLDGYEDEELNNMENIDKYTLDEILEENQNVDVTGSQEETAEEIVFEKTDWRLVLINKQHPIPEDYSFTLGTIKGSMKCDERILEDLLAMLQGAKEDGVDLVICSPYRDLNRQEVLFDRKIGNYMGRGMSYLEAYKLASQAVTVPGASEHQIGLALDIVTTGYPMLNEGFGETEAGKWLAANSCEYGFILRYPKGKEYITSIEYEPWHFRYVGKEAAKVITAQGITLEEFVEGL